MENFILNSKKIFLDKYCYENLNYITSKKQVELKCKIHNNKFIILPRAHLDTDHGGCEYCRFDLRFNNFQTKSNNNFDNNFEINKSTYKSQEHTVEIKCLKHNYIFYVIGSKHLTQTDGGCEKCNKNHPENMISQIIKKSNQKFKDNYDFSKFEYNLANICSILKCKKHNHEFEISPTNHINSKFGGCYKCVYEDKSKVINKKKNSIEKKILKATCELQNDEIFKAFKLDKYTGLYQISNYGKVYSIRNNIYMKLHKNKNGYNQVRLYNIDGKSKFFRVHYLVALTFIENTNKDKKFIDHINNKRDDNYYKNLRWVTHNENMNNLKIHNKIHLSKKYKKNEYKNNISDFTNIGFVEKHDFSGYKINNEGIVINEKNKILSETINDDYKLISLRDKITNKYIQFRLHRLIAHIFVKKPFNYNDNYVVNHIDENRQNNNISNLEWCTISENIQKFFLNKHKRLIGKFDINTDKLLNTYTSYKYVCDELKIKWHTKISKCCRNIYESAYGYKWKFIKNE
jgi:hypothetical protein